MPLHLLAISGRRVFRTIRRDETSAWTHWQDLNVAVGLLAAPKRLACAIVNGALHICVLEANALWHTLERSENTFTGWGATHSAAFPGITMGSSVDCAAIGSQLHVCLDGFRISGDIMTFPAVHRSIRNAAGAWSTPREIMQRSAVIRDIACANRAASGSSRLEVLARSQVQAGAGASRTTIEALVHTTVLPSGARNADVSMALTLPPASATNNVPDVRTIAAAGIGSQLHVMLAQEGELFHTVSAGAGASDVYGSVRTLVGDAGFGWSPLDLPACANVGGNLHVCAMSGGRVMHTIRLANGLWRNPESSAAGFWADVTATLGGLPDPVTDLACAGSAT